MDWPAKAKVLASSIGKNALHARACEEMEASSGAVAVAVSGGSDSLAALLLVYAHFPQLCSRLSVLHFDHRLRGHESEADARFTKEVARALGLSFQSEIWKNKRPELTISEAQARSARHRFFDKFVSNNKGAVLVTGHQRDDVLETLMLRIARASNLGGLSAPRPVSRFSNGKTMVRPLLSISKAELEGHMLGAGIDWRTDASNDASEFDRNKLRNHVIPKWQKSTQYDLGHAAAQVRHYLEEADEAVDYLLDRSEFPQHGDNPAKLPASLSVNAVLRRWLQLWISSQTDGKSLSPAISNEIIKSLRSNEKNRWSFGTGFVEWNPPTISYVETEHSISEIIFNTPLRVGGRFTLPSGPVLEAQNVVATPELLKALRSGEYSEDSTVFLDIDSLESDSIVVRNWREGDCYHALNAPGSRKLQDMFVDRKIPREERKNLPVVTTEDSLILWTPGLPVNHQFRVTEKTKEILQLTYTFLH